MSGTVPLPREVPAEVVRHASPSGGAFLIGGQALNFWAERYSEIAPELNEYGPFVTKDVDFFGTADAARELAHSLGGTIRLPTADNHTPQSAIVTADVLGHRVEIDFLWNVMGPPADQLKKQMVEVSYPIRGTHGDTTVPMSIMHPVHCLQSRARTSSRSAGRCPSQSGSSMRPRSWCANTSRRPWATEKMPGGPASRHPSCANFTAI